MSIARTGSLIMRMAARLFLVLASLIVLAVSPASGKNEREHTADVRDEHMQASAAHAVAKQRFRQAEREYSDAVRDSRNERQNLQIQLMQANQYIANKQREIDEFRGSTNTDDAARVAVIRARMRLAQESVDAGTARVRQIDNTIQHLADRLRTATEAVGRASEGIRGVFTGETPVQPVQIGFNDATIDDAADRVHGIAGQAVAHHNQEQLPLNFAELEGRIRRLDESIQSLQPGRQRDGQERSRNKLIDEIRQSLEEFRAAERQYHAILGALNQHHPDNRPPPQTTFQPQVPGPAAAATLAQGNLQYTAAPAAPQGGAPTYDALSNAQMAPGGTHNYGGASSSAAAMAPVPPATAAHVNQGVVHHNQFQQLPVDQPPSPWDDI